MLTFEIKELGEEPYKKQFNTDRSIQWTIEQLLQSQSQSSFIEYDNSMVWNTKLIPCEFNINSVGINQKEEVRVLCPSKHFVTGVLCLTQQRHII